MSGYTAEFDGRRHVEAAIDVHLEKSVKGRLAVWGEFFLPSVGRAAGLCQPPLLADCHRPAAPKCFEVALLVVIVVVARETRHGEGRDAVAEVGVDDEIEVPRPRNG